MIFSLQWTSGYLLNNLATENWAKKKKKISKTTTRQGSPDNFFSLIYMKMEFSSQGREMLLFLITNMAAVTSHANNQILQFGFLT